MLNGHKLRTDSVSIADVAHEFVSSNEDRKRDFGTADNFKKWQSKEDLFNVLAILDTITRDDVYVKFVEVANKMARKCKINGETLNLMFLFIGEIF